MKVGCKTLKYCDEDGMSGWVILVAWQQMIQYIYLYKPFQFIVILFGNGSDTDFVHFVSRHCNYEKPLYRQMMVVTVEKSMMLTLYQNTVQLETYFNIQNAKNTKMWIWTAISYSACEITHQTFNFLDLTSLLISSVIHSK